VKKLERFTKSSCLDWRKPVLGTMQQVKVQAKAHPGLFKQQRNVEQIFLGRPKALCRQTTLCGFVGGSAIGTPWDEDHPRHTTLQAHRKVALF
jgi:hypothetical protein